MFESVKALALSAELINHLNTNIKELSQIKRDHSNSLHRIPDSDSLLKNNDRKPILTLNYTH